MNRGPRQPELADLRPDPEVDGGADQAVEAPTGSGPPFRAWRAGLIAVILCSLFGAVIARAYQLQVSRAPDLSREAASQLAGSVEIRARRGAIFDRHGAEMAVSVRADLVFARPSRVTTPREAATALAPLLGQGELTLFGALTTDSRFIYLARRVAPHTADRIRALHLPGIGTESGWLRYYPMRWRAGHLLGFTGDEGFGLEGIERSHNPVLAGGAMEVRGLRDALGRPILATESPELEAMEGASIVLTLDARIQRIAERELERVVEAESARTAVIVVVDPHTGEVLAMTNWPPFDPNRFRSHHASDWRNQAVTDAWEPGSTMKAFTYAAALDANLITPDMMLDCGGGRVQIGRHRLRDHVHEAQLPAWQVIQMSSNIGAYRMGALLGEDALYEAFRRFGFGQSTGTGLGGEQAGLLAEPPWAEIELANRAFGQGVNATPIQMAMAYSAIANDGVLLHPMLVREVRNKDGQVLEHFEPVERGRAVSVRAARLTMDALRRVTEGRGTGTQAAVPGVAVAGKTGTAQQIDPETGEYAELWMSSFIGIVPADAPLFTIVVMVDQPQVGHYGGDVAAPVFARLAEQALATRGIYWTPETHEAADPSSPVQTPAPDPMPEIGGPLELAPLTAEPDGRPERVIVPDRSLAEALATAERLDLLLEVHDWGWVAHQWPAPGGSVLRGSTVDVYMRVPYDARLSQATREEGRVGAADPAAGREGP